MQRAKNFRDKRRPSPLNVDLAKEHGMDFFLSVFAYFYFEFFITFAVAEIWVGKVSHQSEEGQNLTVLDFRS